MYLGKMSIPGTFFSRLEIKCTVTVCHVSFSVADPEGAQQARATLKLDRLLCVLIPFCIRILNDKAQIARESLKTPKASRALISGPWTPGERNFGFRARNVRSRT